MATVKVEERPATRTPYEADYYTWSIEQAALLRAGRLSEIDAEKIAEELDGMGRSEFHALESAVKVTVVHMLKWDRQPERRSRSWVQTIAEHRRRIDRLLRENPGLKRHVPECLGEAYKDARGWAAVETRLPIEEFPRTCPYEWVDIRERSFELDGMEPE